MKWSAFLLGALALSLALAVFASPFASSSPDGLERVAMDKGFLDKANETPYWSHAPVSDYEMPGVSHPGLGTALAGLAGTLATFGSVWLLARVASRRALRRKPEGQS